MANGDLSKNIGKHGTCVGVLYLLKAGIVLAVATYLLMLRSVPPKNAEAEVIIEDLHIDLFIGVAFLLIALVYWIGFIKRVRCCITFCLVLEGINLYILGMSVVAVCTNDSLGRKASNAYSTVLTAGFAVVLYMVSVLRKMQDMMFFGTMPNNEVV